MYREENFVTYVLAKKGTVGNSPLIVWQSCLHDSRHILMPDSVGVVNLRRSTLFFFFSFLCFPNVFKFQMYKKILII